LIEIISSSKAPSAGDSERIIFIHAEYWKRLRTA